MFAAYSTHVYSSAAPKSASDSRELLLEIRLPELTSDHNELLDTDISEDELEEAIHGLKSGKAMGPNGIPAEVHKKYSELLGSHILNLFLGAREEGILPLDLRRATIVVCINLGNQKRSAAPTAKSR